MCNFVKNYKIRDLCANIKSFFAKILKEISNDIDLYSVHDNFNDLLYFKCEGSGEHLTAINSIEMICTNRDCDETLQKSDNNTCWIHLKGILI